MDSTFTVISQNLKVTESLIEKDKFLAVQMIGNRIMTDLLIADKSELMILGWIVKDLGSEFATLQAEKNERLQEAKDYFKDFLRIINNEVKRENKDPKAYWNAYNKIEIDLRAIELSENERAIYKEQNEFTKIYAIKMIDLFLSSKDMLFVKHNALILSIIKELSRTYIDHGGKELLITYIVFKALDQYYRYVFYEAFFVNEKDLIDESKVMLDEIISHICNLKLALNDEKPIRLYDNLNEILGKLGIAYRLYNLKYGDLVFASTRSSDEEQTEATLKLSEGAQSKIGEVIKESLNKNK